jgi:hypothetical protein
MHVNIKSLPHKFALFTTLAHSANPDVLAMSDFWLRKDTKNPEISFPNLNIFRQDRIAKGGGVAIYCRVLSYYPGLCPNNSSFYF